MEHLFEEIHGNNSNVLFPVTFFNGRYELALGLKDCRKEVEALRKEYPHLIEDVYFIPQSHFQYFCYHKDNVWIDIHLLDLNYWKTFQVDKAIEQQLEAMEEYEKVNDYESIFSSMEKKILITRYIELFDSIPEEQKYSCFREIWVRSEYGFDLFDSFMLEKIFASKELSEERNESMEVLKEQIENKDKITIYRGQASRSTSPDEALSWTLDVNVAKFFAKRFGGKGRILKAEININDVYDYIISRNEKEILLNPEKLMNVETIYNI